MTKPRAQKAEVAQALATELRVGGRPQLTGLSEQYFHETNSLGRKTVP